MRFHCRSKLIRLKRAYSSNHCGLFVFVVKSIRLIDSRFKYASDQIGLLLTHVLGSTRWRKKDLQGRKVGEQWPLFLCMLRCVSETRYVIWTHVIANALSGVQKKKSFNA